MWTYPVWLHDEPIESEIWIKTGQDVFFVGLFDPLPGTGSVEALVRSGTVARRSARASVRDDPNSTQPKEVDAHLVEAMAWGGESGSPVYAYDQKSWLPGAELERTLRDLSRRGYPRDSDVRSRVFPNLIGLLYGHYTISEEIIGVGAPATIGNLEVNSGIAVVIPSSKILEALMDGRLVAERDRILEERRKRPHGSVAKPDSSQ